MGWGWGPGWWRRLVLPSNEELCSAVTVCVADVVAGCKLAAATHSSGGIKRGIDADVRVDLPTGNVG